MVLSKHVACMTCAELIHPWSASCLDAYRLMFWSSVIGSSKLFLPIMLVQCMLKIKKLKKVNKKFAKEMLFDLFKTIAVGTTISTTQLIFICMFRRILGKFTYASTIFLPGFFAGLSFSMLTPQLKTLMSTTFNNAAMESIVLKTCYSDGLKRSVTAETLFFMTVNACLMYASKASRVDQSNYSWFFKPDKSVRNDVNHSYLKNIYLKMRKYFGLGIGLGVLRTILGDITVLMPKNFSKFLKKNTLKMGIFAASYVAAYELIFYGLYRYFQKDSPVFALPAGFLAGISYVIDPNLSMNLTVLFNLVQIVYNVFNVQMLKRISMETIFFCLSAGALFQIYVFYPKSCSKIGEKFIKITTNNKCESIAKAFQKFYFLF